MSEHTVYGCTRSVGSRIYRVSGYSSPEEAEFAAMSMAQDDGQWKAPKLREKWWQFWRQTEYTNLQKRLIAREVLK